MAPSGESRPVENQEPATEAVSLVVSPTVELIRNSSSATVTEQGLLRRTTRTQTGLRSVMWYGYAIEAIYIMIGTVLIATVAGILVYH